MNDNKQFSEVILHDAKVIKKLINMANKIGVTTDQLAEYAIKEYLNNQRQEVACNE